ncbi:HNH endonuclease [Pantoea stewartii subsp. indologenes]|uniref:HNH endonuclease n=1 Tax=Pantoea stewartii TaxID=66269 RepID=UPI003FA4CE9A
MLYASQVIYLITKGDIPEGYFIDHVDGDPRNNHPDNLRLASNKQNQWNSKAHVNKLNPELPKGIYEDRPGIFRAYITKDGKSYRKGSKFLQTVIKWLNAKRIELHGEYAHG